MKECNISLTKVKKRNRIRHEQSEKQKYFSDLIINRYSIKNKEIDHFKDILQSYFDKHKKKFDKFNVWIICKKEKEIVREIKLPDKVIIEKRYNIPYGIIRKPMHLMGSSTPHNVNKIPMILMETCVVYLDN